VLFSFGKMALRDSDGRFQLHTSVATLTESPRLAAGLGMPLSIGALIPVRLTSSTYAVHLNRVTQCGVSLNPLHQIQATTSLLLEAAVRLDSLLLDMNCKLTWVQNERETYPAQIRLHQGAAK
jgi:hypothetical protein